MRQRLEIHRTLPQCARCHNKIDPPGFALENFDASGKWRDREGFGYQGRINEDDPLIDAASQLPDRTAIDGVHELQAALVEREELFLRALAGKLFAYALGRAVTLSDEPLLRDTWLTGTDLTAVPGSDYTNTLSLDQLVAEHLGGETRFPSLQLSDQSGTGSAGHSQTLSFDRSGTPLPAENSPQRVFERLFVPDSAADRTATLQRYAERKSILDNVLREASSLRRGLGTEDQRKLDEYLHSVRATEQRVEPLVEWVDVPKPVVPSQDLQLNSQAGNAHDRPMWLDVMLELSYLSLVTDTTRVIAFEWSREAGGYGGGGENHHELSHHGGDQGMLDKLAEIDRFHVGRLARFLELLQRTEELDGSMLDQTVVLLGSGMNSGLGGDHSPKNLPLLVAGGRKLGLRNGQHLAFDQDKHPPMSNVLLTVAQAVGCETEQFSDASSTLTGLS